MTGRLSVISRNSAVMMTPHEIKRRDMPTVHDISTPKSSVFENQTPRLDPNRHTIARI